MKYLLPVDCNLRAFRKNHFPGPHSIYASILLFRKIMIESCMQFLRFSLISAFLTSLFFFTGCAEFQKIGLASYDHPAFRPKDPSKVVVKVSLSQQMIYVMEGKRSLLVTACCVGLPNKPTPKGSFNVTRKERNKRSGSYGFAVRKNQITAVEAGHACGPYVGYPMAYWVEFGP